MNPDDILDAPVANDIRNALQPGERLLWEGSPLWDPGGFFLFKSRNWSNFFSFIAYTSGMVLLTYILRPTDPPDFWLVVLVVLGLYVANSGYKYMERRAIRYGVSDQRAFFQLWEWGRKKLYIINLDEVMQVTYQEFDDKAGVLYFFPMPNKSFNFSTYDLSSREKRFQPTFEMVPEVVELQRLVSGLLGK